MALAKAAKKALKNTYKNAAPVAKSVGDDATNNILRGLKRNFKNADPQSLEKLAPRFKRAMGEEASELIAKDKNVFGSIIKGDAARLEKFADSPEKYFRSASSNKGGWLNRATDEGVENFKKLRGQAEDVSSRYSNMKTIAGDKQALFEARDTQRKLRASENSDIIRSIRTGKTGSENALSANEIREGIRRQRAGGTNFEEMSPLHKRAKAASGAVDVRAENRVSSNLQLDQLNDFSSDEMAELINSERMNVKTELGGGSVSRPEGAPRRAPETPEELIKERVQSNVQSIYETRDQAAQAAQGNPSSVSNPSRSSGGGSRGGSESSDGWKPTNTVDKYMNQRLSTHVDDLQAAFQGGQEMNQDVIDDFTKRFRLDPESKMGQDFGRLVGDGQTDKAIEMMRNNAQGFASQANTVDQIMAHRVPQKGAAIVGGAWLVSNMSAKKGNQSNSELYGQQTPYR